MRTKINPVGYLEIKSGNPWNECDSVRGFFFARTGSAIFVQVRRHMKVKTRLTNPIEWGKEPLFTAMKAVTQDMNSIGPGRQDILINRIATKADNPEDRVAFVAFFL